MNNSSNQNAKKQNSIINIIVIAIIAVFVVVGAFATYSKIADGIEEKAITNGEKEPTVAYLAKQSGVTVEDFLAGYGLELGDTITKDTTESEFLDNLTIENYLKYDGNSQTAEEVIEGTGLTDKVTKDTLWKDFLPQVPAVSILGEESFNQLKEQLGLGDEINYDTTYGELEALLEEQTNAAADETAENTDGEANEEATEEAAQENAAE